MTGQTRISRQKRDRSCNQLLDLLRQGFSIEDVTYAIEWARESITGPIHSFGIIPEIIGQALGKRERTRAGRDQMHRDKGPPQAQHHVLEAEQQRKEQQQLEAIGLLWLPMNSKLSDRRRYGW